MKNRIALLVIFLVAFFTLSTGYAQLIDQMPLTTVEKNNHEKLDAIDFHIKYPLIKDNAPNSAAKNFNMMIDDLVETETGNFRTMVTEIHSDVDMSKEPYTVPSAFTMDYEILLLTDKPKPLLSILFTIDTMVSGAAHPNVTHRVINYDFKTGEGIAIAELFKPKSDFIPPLNHYLASKLQPVMHKSEKQMVQDNEINYSQWNITSDGILVTLDEFPHVYGLQQVLVPYQSIKLLLNPKSPIARCLNHDFKLKC